MVPSQVFTCPFPNYTRFLLTHKNISQICYCCQIHYRVLQLTAVFVRIWHLWGVSIVLLAMVPQSNFSKTVFFKCIFGLPASSVRTINNCANFRLHLLYLCEYPTTEWFQHFFTSDRLLFLSYTFHLSINNILYFCLFIRYFPISFLQSK